MAHANCAHMQQLVPGTSQWVSPCVMRHDQYRATWFVLSKSVRWIRGLPLLAGSTASSWLRLQHGCPLTCEAAGHCLGMVLRHVQYPHLHASQQESAAPASVGQRHQNVVLRSCSGAALNASESSRCSSTLETRNLSHALAASLPSTRSLGRTGKGWRRGPRLLFAKA